MIQPRYSECAAQPAEFTVLKHLAVAAALQNYLRKITFASQNTPAKR